MASNGIHLYVVLATNLLLLLAVVRRAKRSPPQGVRQLRDQSVENW